MVESIVVRTPNWIGDALLCTPAVHSLREAFPRARITGLVHSRVREVFERNPDLDNLLSFDPRGEDRGPVRFLRVVGRIKKEKPHLAVIFPLSFASAWMVFLAGARQRIGYAAEGRGLLLHPALPYRCGYRTKHLVDRYLGLVRSVGAESAGRRPLFRVTGQDEKKAEELLAAEGITQGERLIGLNPGATFGPAKQWPEERFIELAKKIRHHKEARVILFGSDADIRRAEGIRAGAGSDVISLAGKTTLGTLAATFKRCAAVVSNDTGTMHLAGAAGTPVIALFGSTSPVWTGPLGEKDVVVRRELPCAPCFHRECPLRTTDCLRKITADEVLQVVRRFC